MNACSCLCSGSERCTLPIYCGTITFLEHLQQCVLLGHPGQTVSVMSPYLTDIFLLKDLSSRWGGSHVVIYSFMLIEIDLKGHT